MTTLSSSSNCKDVRNPIKLSSGRITERYLMRQRYLRSYPLMTKKKEKLAGNVARRMKKWLKEKQMKYCWFDDQEHMQTGWPGGDNKKSKPNPARSSNVAGYFKLLLGCVAKVDVFRKEIPEPFVLGKKAVIS